MRLAIWSPLPPAPSGIADYVAEGLGALSRLASIELVCPDPAAVDPEVRRRVVVKAPGQETPPDLDVYHVGNSPAHAYIYRAALTRPGVVVLHDWNLHHLLLAETVERGDADGYLHELRRNYRERGVLAGRQIARALGGEMLASLFPLNERLIEGSLGVVALSRHSAERAARALPDRPVLHLPMHYVPLPGPVPSRLDARGRLGLPEDALIVTAPGLATAAKRLDVVLHVLAQLATRVPTLRLVVAGATDPNLPLAQWLKASGLEHKVKITGRVSLDDFVRHLVAADVVLALRFPSFGEMSAAMVRAMGLGRPVLVTAGTPLAEEMPEGTIVPVDPGPYEEAELAGLLGRLLEDATLRETIGRQAAAHVRAVHGVDATTAALVAFLDAVHARKSELTAAAAASRPATGLLASFEDEVRWSARDLGLPGIPPGVDALLGELTRERPAAR